VNNAPRNHWYVAAWTHEVCRTLLGRTLCGEPVLLYRTESGRAIAIGDRCAHRRFPLSLGKLVEDNVECGYHGFTYDCSGVCVAVPGQGRVPRTAQVHSYPVVERDSVVWVWIGAKDKADPESVPSCPWLSEEGWEWVGEAVHSPFRTSLLVDNLMDLSHETYLHAGLIGTPEIAATPITWDADTETNVIRVARHMSAVECPPFYSETTGMSSPVDRWQDVEFRVPAMWVNHARIAPVGACRGPDGSDPEAAHAKIVHFLTPETDTSCWDFWAVSRDFALGEEQVSDFLLKMNREVVQQDLDALTELERIESREPAGREVSTEIDGGALAARRILRSLSTSHG
jgi:phenylpropionate dioxygenase-like ring-hydroxylating dioxygenase large terminal subunit